MFRYLIISAFIVITISSSVLAEAPAVEWERFVGTASQDRAWWVEETSDSGFIIAGYTYDEEDDEDDIYIIKTNSLGNVEWEKYYGDTLSDRALCIRQIDDGGYIFCGYTSEAGHYARMYVSRLDYNGDSVWAVTNGGERAGCANGVCQILDGTFIAVGHNGEGGFSILKISSDGNILNEDIVDVNADANRVEPTFDGGAVVVGGTTQLFMSKINSNGFHTWLKNYGAESSGYSVTQLADSGYAVFGFKNFSLLDDEFWLIRTDKDGNKLWDKHYGNQYRDHGYGVRQTLDGGFIMTGDMFPPDGTSHEDVYIVRTDATGDTLWTKTVGGDMQDLSYCIQKTSDSGYVLVGRSQSGGHGEYDIYLVKLAKDPSIITGIWDETPIMPKSFELYQNYPNPFNPTTKIKFNLQRRSRVALEIYNVLGQHIVTLIEKELAAGDHEYAWNGRLVDGTEAPTGVYFYRLKTDQNYSVKKMILMK